VVGQRPADHPPAGQVHNRGQVRPALPGADIGDVPGPGGVQLEVGGTEVAGQQVHGLGLGIGNSGPSGASAAAAGQTGGHHQTGHPLLAHMPAQLPQLGMDPRDAVGTCRGGVDEAQGGQVASLIRPAAPEERRIGRRQPAENLLELHSSHSSEPAFRQPPTAIRQ
jgi:hypothetical protein